MLTIRQPAFELTIVVEDGERHEDVCDTDGWVTVLGKGTWGATFLTMDELRARWDEEEQAGERAAGQYYATPGLVILREPGIDNIVAAVRDIVDTELYPLVLVRQTEVDDDRRSLAWLIERLEARPKMFSLDGSFSMYAAFLRGCQYATEGSSWAGDFRSWLVEQLGDGGNLGWEALILRLSFPTEPQKWSYLDNAPRSDEDDRTACHSLLSQLKAFDENDERFV
ncbi:hypothetical protein ACWGID_05485 [Kribbella sp. NPDC054772]